MSPGLSRKDSVGTCEVSVADMFMQTDSLLLYVQSYCRLEV